MKRSNVLIFPGRPLQKVTAKEEKAVLLHEKIKAKLLYLTKEFGPIALYTAVWVIMIIAANS